MASGSVNKPITASDLAYKLPFASIGNVDQTKLDALTTPGLYQGFIANGVAKYSNVWALIIVNSYVAGQIVCEQVEITNYGIAKRHAESGSWGAWKGVAFA